MKRHLSAALAGIVVAAVPSGLSACTVCFGGADSNLVNGFFWGVIILISLPLAMTAGFIVSIARASRRKKAS